MWTVPTFAQSFSPICSNPSYPSPGPAKPLQIDAKCGLTGAGGEEAVQNSVKNDFCAPGLTQPISIADLQKLQAQVNEDSSINFGDEDAPPRHKGPATSRGPLQNLGEGKLVTLQGFVLFGREEGAESVNCEKAVPNQPAFHDIHIELVDSSSVSDECSGIVAEMIPHHRPASWTADRVQEVADAKAMVRVTGQLFFDSSHFPCQNGQGVRDNPKRASLWEIHPIYKFEVCQGDCTGSDAQWVPIDQWKTTKQKK